MSIKQILRPIQYLFILMYVSISLGCGSHRKVEFEQVYAGDNGQDKIGAEYFSSPTDLNNSWVKQTLNETDFQLIFSNLDFSKQMLVAFSVGKRPSYSGKIKIVDIYQYTDADYLPINILIKIGVLAGACKNDSISFPFVLAIIDIPEGFQPVGGFDIQNFPDKCEKSL